MAESQKPKQWWWNPNSKRWEFGGREKGVAIAFADGNGLGSDKGIRGASTGSFNAVNAANFANVARILVGGGTISLIKKLTGTLPATNVGTNLVGIATLTNMGSAGIAAGDLIFVTPKAALITTIGVGGAWIPTTNVVNIKLVNPQINLAGSQPAVGFDVLQIRST